MNKSDKAYEDIKEAIKTPEGHDQAVQIMLSDEDFNKHFAEIIEMAQKEEIGDTGIMPKMFVHTKNFENFKEDKFQVTMVGFADFPDSQEDKRKAMMGLGAKFAERKGKWINFPWQITFISEAWMKKDMLPKDLPEGKRISDLEDKEEVLMVQSMSMDHRTSFAIYKMIKDSSGRITELKQEIFSPYKESDGKKEDGTKPYILYPFWEGFTLALEQSVKGGDFN